MDKGMTWPFRQHRSVLVRSFLIVMALTILGQGCAEMDQRLRESQIEDRLAQQMERAEDELKKGHLISARTLFERVYRESRRPATRERALFFSAFTTVLDTRDKNRLERGQRMFIRVSESFPDGEFGQIAAHVATALSDVLTTMEALKEDNVRMGQEIDLERSRSREMVRTIQKKKRVLSEESEKIADLKKSISLKDKEIESLKLKIKKLEEIHKEIKKKRQSIS